MKNFKINLLKMIGPPKEESLNLFRDKEPFILDIRIVHV